jgi:hypothetical protein
LLWHCFSGCSWEDVHDGFRRLGIFTGNPSGSPPAKPAAKPPEKPERSNAERTAYALEVWRSSRPAAGTLVETYLQSRGIHLPPPLSLRFHPDLKHTPSGKRWPAMVALVQRASDGEPLAIHRTWLRRDGAGKAPIEKPKMMLGPAAGGVVFLAEPAELVAIGEGIESSLAGLQASGIATWAALSTSGLRNITLPSSTREVIVLADGDQPGEDAALAFGRKWTRQGVRVRIARPPAGRDFADIVNQNPLPQKGVEP